MAFYTLEKNASMYKFLARKKCNLINYILICALLDLAVFCDRCLLLAIKKQAFHLRLKIFLGKDKYLKRTLLVIINNKHFP